MVSGMALGSYSSALVLSEVAAIHVNGNSATTPKTASGIHRPRSRLRHVSSPTMSFLPHVKREQHQQQPEHRHHAEGHRGSESHLARAHAQAVGVGGHEVRGIGGPAAGEQVDELKVEEGEDDRDCSDVEYN